MTALLLTIGLILIALNIVAIKKEKGSFKYTLDNTENDMQDFQVEIGKLRREIGETVLDLQKEIEDIKNSLQIIQNSDSHEEGKKEKEVVEDTIENHSDENYKENIQYNEEENKEENKKEENKAVAKGNSVKIEQIGNMIDSGMTIEEISEKLNIGKGEVLLIKELYLK